MHTPWEWALAFLAAFLVGLSKTGITGMGILAVALFAGLLPARESVGIVLIVLISADIVAVSTYRREAHWPSLVRLFPWAALGVILGAVLMSRIDDALMRRLIGIIVTGLAVYLVAQRLRGADAKGNGGESLPGAPRRMVAALTGISAGFTTMVANAAGPVMSLYLLSMRLPKYIFIGTAAWYFCAMNLFKVPFGVWAGIINGHSLLVSVKLIPLALVGALVGRAAVRHIHQRLFENLVLVLTLIAGVRLLFR